ncbi:hypothetical protein NUW54_g2211 [Trametes sanguinea]|uniref:Uncharacterized protein n=1 Tax=Trametes sanguinea TaxID=158606 RepID=A0ACC1Q5J9_9APHY|nr:hypothetical protein NUW54_g2211 [Trametes sanguinea]
MPTRGMIGRLHSRVVKRSYPNLHLTVDASLLQSHDAHSPILVSEPLWSLILAPSGSLGRPRTLFLGVSTPSHSTQCGDLEDDGDARSARSHVHLRCSLWSAIRRRPSYNHDIKGVTDCQFGEMVMLSQFKFTTDYDADRCFLTPGPDECQEELTLERNARCPADIIVANAEDHLLMPSYVTHPSAQRRQILPDLQNDGSEVVRVATKSGQIAPAFTISRSNSAYTVSQRIPFAQTLVPLCKRSILTISTCVSLTATTPTVMTFLNASTPLMCSRTELNAIPPTSAATTPHAEPPPPSLLPPLPRSTSSLTRHDALTDPSLQRRALRDHDALRAPAVHAPPAPHRADADLLRAHLQEASALATANYPETLSTIAVVNSPAFFPTVWGWIKVRPFVRLSVRPSVAAAERERVRGRVLKREAHRRQPWFDEGTRRKVHVLGRDPGPTLRTLIDPKDLPKPYGGELDWKFEDEPALDDAAKAVIGEMPKGPVVFENGEVRRPTPPEPADTGSASQ